LIRRAQSTACEARRRQTGCNTDIHGDTVGHTIQTHTYMMILRATHTQCYSGKQAATQTHMMILRAAHTHSATVANGLQHRRAHRDTVSWATQTHTHGDVAGHTHTATHTWCTVGHNTHTHTVLQWATQIYYMVILWVTHIHGDMVGHTDKMKLKAVLMWVMISDWMRI